MKFLVPGYPKEMSEYIEAPNMAELMTYQTFFDSDPSLIYKYGSEWQKKLLDSVPLKNDKKYVTVRMECHIQAPGYRTAVSTQNIAPGEKINNRGWHIDGQFPLDYQTANERVHLYQTHCKSLTEFNLNPFEIDIEKNWDNVDVSNFLNTEYNNLSIVGKISPANKIVTFHNEVHRSVAPRNMEFRFLMRVRETNRETPPSTKIENMPQSNIAQNLIVGTTEAQIIRTSGKIEIVLPDVKNGLNVESDFTLLPE